MKVLFFVEPHGIRDSFSEYEAALRRMLPALAEISARPGWEARLLCNQIMADLILREAPGLWPHVLIPTPAERQDMQMLSIAWDAEGMRRWRVLMRDPDAEITRFYTHLLQRLQAEDFEFDAIVLWGENEAVRKVAEEKSLIRLHLELASFRAPFAPALLMDPDGVNGTASTTRLELDGLEEHPPSTRALLEAVYPGGVLQASAPAAKTPPTALVPLQLSDDANILLYSTYAGPAEFLDDVVPSLLDAGFAVQLKPHPGAVVRGGEVWAAQELALAPWRQRASVEILDEDPPEALFHRLVAADLVVGLNSSVLFETTLLGGIAVPMGEACFAPPGAHPSLRDAITHHSNHEWRADKQRQARRVAAALLSAAFVPESGMVNALIRRLDLWRAPQARNPHASLVALARSGEPEWVNFL